LKSESFINNKHKITLSASKNQKEVVSKTEQQKLSNENITQNGIYTK